jgi:hypothetical protein
MRERTARRFPVVDAECVGDANHREKRRVNSTQAPNGWPRHSGRNPISTTWLTNRHINCCSFSVEMCFADQIAGKQRRSAVLIFRQNRSGEPILREDRTAIDKDCRLSDIPAITAATDPSSPRRSNRAGRILPAAAK